MENLGHTLDPGTRQNGLETAELIQKFFNMFDATREIDFLDSAIGLAQELSLSDGGALPLLKNLQEQRSNFLEQANRNSGLLNSVENRCRDVMKNMAEEMEAIRTLSATFEETGDIDYLDSAIGMTEELVTKFILEELIARVIPEESVATVTEEAAALLTPVWELRQYYLSLLTGFLSARCKRTGGLEDIDKTIKWMEVAVAEIPPDNRDRVGELDQLSVMLFRRYEKCNDLEDLQKTIKRAEEAVAAAPPDHPNRTSRLNNLGSWLGRRYERLGDLQDLERAIKRAEEAVAATPLDHPDRASQLNNLGIWLCRRYERLGDLQDLEQAIKWAEEAVAATPLDHPDRAPWLSNLGSKLCIRYERLGDLQDLEQAIKRAEEAVAATPLDHPNRASQLNNLGSKLCIRYERLGDLQDLEQAIKRAEEAVTVTHPDHPDRAGRLSNLVITLTSRYKRTDSVKDLYYILRISYEAWHCRISPPKIRIKAARSAGLLLATRSMWQESSPLLGEAVKILPKVSSRSMGRGDQEHRLSSFTQLTSEAVAIAFKAGAEATHCLRLLEFGRGIITGLVIDCRSDSDLSELQSNQPKLFRKFHELRIEIDSPLKTDSDESTYQQKLRRREEAVQELEETLNSIRKLSGFEGFQLPPRSDDLMAMAGEGPIVIFNSTEFRSDAIVVTSSAIKALELPKLHYKSVKDRMSQMAKLVRGRRSTYQWRNERMEEILLWLWDVAVEPVFDALKLDTAAHHKLPRIWWIGVGLLAMAPFHAAGDHSPGSTRNTISRAISSYIPTMKALSYARQKKLELFSRPDSRLLLVSMPTTPAKKPTTPAGKPAKLPKPLKNATEETKTITGIVKGKAITTLLHCPSTAQVIAELPSCHAVHFACHGVSDGRNPSNSHLILRKDGGSELGTPDELTVGAISNTNIKQAQIAYLSACSTAENASASLVDESIYIASGFQLAGFSHVLATQWISNDEACLQVAGDFYTMLFSNGPGGGEEGHQKVSASFHYAVKKLRDKNLKQPIKWACYIHTGA